MPTYGIKSRTCLGPTQTPFSNEVELIGRYSLLQRGKSYAEVARWMGQIEREQYPGLVAVATITDDFELAILDQKGDRDEVARKLRSKGIDEDAIIAARAEKGMRIIEREALKLQSPDERTLGSTYARLKDVHAKAYDWYPTEIGQAEASLKRPMRSHVRRWINEWDLKRLYPGSEVTTEEQPMRPTYDPDPEIEAPSETNGGEES